MEDLSTYEGHLGAAFSLLGSRPCRTSVWPVGDSLLVTWRHQQAKGAVKQPQRSEVND